MTRPRAFACTAILVSVGVAALLEWRTPMLADTAWLLWVARSSLAGAVVYRDLWETNPPLSYWLHTPPVLLAEFTGWPVRLCFVLFTLAWSGACAALVARVWMRWRQPPYSTATVLVAVTLILFVFPGPFFGQREHFMLAAALPWLTLIAVRDDGSRVPTVLAALTAISVAFAIALKPFYVGWWLAMPVVAACTRRAPTGPDPFWRRSEFWLVPAIGVGYVLVVARGAYPAFLHGWSALYWRYAHRPWWFVVGGTPLALTALACMAIGAFPASRTTLGRALLAGTIAGWIGAVAQGKGLPYHYMPAIGLGFLLLAQGNRWTRLTLVSLATIWLAGLVFLGVDGGAAQRRHEVEFANAVGRGTVLVLGAYGDDAWSLNSALGRPWLSPHPALWWLLVSHGRDTVAGLPRWHGQDSLLRTSLLPRTRPDVLLLGVAGVEVAPYLRRSPQWSILLDGYRPGELVAGYQVWRRIQ